MAKVCLIRPPMPAPVVCDQAAKIMMMRPHRWTDFSFGEWLTRASEPMHRNKAAVALANKLARMAWSMLRHKTEFDAPRDEVAIGV